MYRCENCGCEFSEPNEVTTTYAKYLGIDDAIGGNHLTLYLCPRCDSEDIEEVEEDEEE